MGTRAPRLDELETPDAGFAQSRPSARERRRSSRADSSRRRRFVSSADAAASAIVAIWRTCASVNSVSLPRRCRTRSTTASSGWRRRRAAPRLSPMSAMSSASIEAPSARHREPRDDGGGGAGALVGGGVWPFTFLFCSCFGLRASRPPLFLPAIVTPLVVESSGPERRVVDGAAKRGAGGPPGSRGDGRPGCDRPEGSPRSARVGVCAATVRRSSSVGCPFAGPPGGAARSQSSHRFSEKPLTVLNRAPHHQKLIRRAREEPLRNDGRSSPALHR